LRIRAKKSQLAAAVAIEVSKQGIGRLEDGQVVRVSTAQYRDLLDFYGADEDSKTEILSLLQEVKAVTVSPGSWPCEYFLRS
jgi:hypothetical protein